jgi:hypothetical protein
MKYRAMLLLILVAMLALPFNGISAQEAPKYAGLPHAGRTSSRRSAAAG